MNPYHKIQTVYDRDPANKYRTLIDGQFARPEFEYLADCEWTFTEKVDGTNIRVMFDGEQITYAGKTDNSQIPAFLVNRLNDVFLPQLDTFKEKFADGVCLYGEGYGRKIQKVGKLYRDDQDFVLFDVKVGDWWLQRSDVVDVADTLNIDVVPIIGTGTLHDMVATTRVGFKSQWGDFVAEGIIARPEVELQTRGGERIITKVKHKDFGR